jgi:hypothetical protein
VSLHVYQTEHRRNRIVAGAFAKGCGAPIVPPAPLLPGAVFMYGCLRGLKPTLDQAIAEGRIWYYADNAYFRRAGKDMQGFFRVTRNALQHDGSGTAKPDRWRRLGLEIKPWRTAGTHVLVCPPDAIYGQLWGLDVERWLGSTMAMLKTATDRPIEVRHRDRLRKAKPFREALRDSWAVVTHQSNAAVEAMLGGVPVICTGACAAAGMGRSDPAMIEDPLLPDDRERWAAVLAANQWTVAEMADGTGWRELNG